jgi:hypothetical protein
VVAELRRMLLMARAAAPDAPLTTLKAGIASRQTGTGGH